MITVADFLKKNGHALCSVEPDSSISHAVRLMADKKIGALPVIEAGKLAGVISEKDCIEKVILKGRSPEETQVEEIMERDMLYTSPVQTVEDCLDIMTRNHVRHLPVIEGASLVGFLSMTDAFRTILNDQKAYICRLENYVMGIYLTL
ncbi:MAG: CBS domain-containing protein [Omnitrophica WOR_2 bacterium]